MDDKGFSGGESEESAGTDGGDIIIGFDDFALPGDDEDRVNIGDDKEGVEFTEEFILTPGLGELDGSGFEFP